MRLECICIPDLPTSSLSPPLQAQLNLFPVSEDEDELEDQEEAAFNDGCDLQELESGSGSAWTRTCRDHIVCTWPRVRY